MSVASRNAGQRNVSRSLNRRIHPAIGAIVVVTEMAGRALAELLDPSPVVLTLAPGYALAESTIDLVERRVVGPVRLVLLTSVAWTTCLLSAASTRLWPAVFTPLYGLSVAERPDFIRRACTSASSGRAVCGIKPWRTA